MSTGTSGAIFICPHSSSTSPLASACGVILSISPMPSFTHSALSSGYRFVILSNMSKLTDDTFDTYPLDRPQSFSNFV